MPASAAPEGFPTIEVPRLWAGQASPAARHVTGLLAMLSRGCLLLLLLFLGLPLAAARQAEPRAPSTVADPPRFAYDDHLLLPLRMHILRAGKLPEANCALTSNDARRIFRKVNGIWQGAGIRFYLNQIMAEEAASQELLASLGAIRTERHLLLLRPRATRSGEMLHVYYLREMGPNGIFLGPDGIFVKETASLRTVEGGIDEPLPRVTAHEIGHALGLEHRQDTFNLLASGTTGTTLNAAEVERARTGASALGYACRPEELARRSLCARTEGRATVASELDSCLAEIPGESPLKTSARERLAAAPCAP